MKYHEDFIFTVQLQKNLSGVRKEREEGGGVTENWQVSLGFLSSVMCHFKY